MILILTQDLRYVTLRYVTICYWPLTCSSISSGHWMFTLRWHWCTDGTSLAGNSKLNPIPLVLARIQLPATH